ncbi:uncharacterized protein LOC119646694 isoform X2 [Hermetia illucens]|uniref:uncharacterized protein LOC119646694 isoform X2 n=1 Tax=Hermetia illucens TaxID=343691 RepID=UPI0018CC3359|nr:uncharacterized protein LOC119646694 isoform X2 [Hermetia illucens]
MKMDSLNYIPLTVIVVVFLIIVACQRAFGKETFANDGRIRNNQQRLQTQTSVASQVQSPTGTSVSSLFTISGLLTAGSRTPSPPKYDMPPSYDEAIVYEKEKAAENPSTVIPIER